MSKKRDSGSKREGLETRVAPIESADDEASEYSGKLLKFLEEEDRRASRSEADIATDPRVMKPESEVPTDPRPRKSVADLETDPRAKPPADDRGKRGAPEVADNRTAFSSQAVMFADALRSRFAHKIYGRTTRRIVRVDEPEGPSTAGGLLARQPISLVARKGSAPSLVCGWLDVSKQEALLRSYESLAIRHEARQGYKLDLTRSEYERFLDDLMGVLETGDIRIRIVVPEEKEAVAPPAPPRPEPAAGVPSWALVLLVLAAFGVGVVVGRFTVVTPRPAPAAAPRPPPAK